MRPTEVFLSHSDRDRATAQRLSDVLIGHGVTVWFSRESILSGQRWHDEIGAALERCDWFLLLVSSHAVASKWVRRELNFALDSERYRNPETNEERIIPVQCGDCDIGQLSWTLPQLQIVDIASDFPNGVRAILRRWGIGLRNELLT